MRSGELVRSLVTRDARLRTIFRAEIVPPPRPLGCCKDKDTDGELNSQGRVALRVAYLRSCRPPEVRCPQALVGFQRQSSRAQREYIHALSPDKKRAVQRGGTDGRACISCIECGKLMNHARGSHRNPQSPEPVNDDDRSINWNDHMFLSSNGDIA